MKYKLSITHQEFTRDMHHMPPGKEGFGPDNLSFGPCKLDEAYTHIALYDDRKSADDALDKVLEQFKYHMGILPRAGHVLISVDGKPKRVPVKKVISGKVKAVR